MQELKSEFLEDYGIPVLDQQEEGAKQISRFSASDLPLILVSCRPAAAPTSLSPSSPLEFLLKMK